MMQSLIHKIRHELNLDDEVLSTLLFENLGKIDTHYDFSLKQVENLAGFLSVPVTDLVSGNLDYNVLRKKFISPSTAIADEYLNAPGTYMDTMRGFANYIELSAGIKTRRRFLENLQLNESVIRNDNIMVNALALYRAGLFLYENGFDNQDMRGAAHYLNTNGKRNAIQSHIGNCRFDSEVVEVMNSFAKSHYEKNFDYHIEKDGVDKFKITAVSREEIHDVLKQKIICSENVLLFKAFTIANTTISPFGRPMKLLDVTSRFYRGRQVATFVFKEQVIRQQVLIS